MVEFLDFLDRTRGSRCTDERDRIYAILGLHFNESDLLSQRIKNLQPDYTKEAVDLFLEVACLCIECGKLLELLKRVCHRPDEDLLALRRPSWIPDWTRASASKPLFDTRTSYNLPGSLKVKQHTHSLTLRGVQLSTILSGSHRVLFTDNMEECMHTIATFWEQYVRSAGSETECNGVNFQFLEAVSLGTLNYRWCSSDLELSRCLCNAIRWHDRAVDYIDRSSGTKEMIYAFWISAQEEIKAIANGAGRRSHAAGASDSAIFYWEGRKLFATVDGNYGLGPRALQEGDVLVAVSQVGLPIVIRRKGDGNGYHFVGTACIPEFDQVRVTQELERAGGELEDFELF